MTKETSDDEIDISGGYNPFLRLFFLGVVIALLCGCFFVIGGYVACVRGGGNPIGLLDLSCVGFKEVGVCEFEGRSYTTPTFSNTTIKIVSEIVDGYGVVNNGD